MFRARPRPYRYLIAQGTIFPLVLMLCQRSFLSQRSNDVWFIHWVEKGQFAYEQRSFLVSFLMRRMLMKAIKSDSRNRPLPSDVPKNFTFKKEAKCTTFLVDMSFICMRMKNHFHIIGWALNLVLIQRPGGTRSGLLLLWLGLQHVGM